MSRWSEIRIDFMIVLPDQTSMATPPDLPDLPPSVFCVLIAGRQTPVHPFLKAADFHDSIVFGSLQCSCMRTI
eukprot:5923522-Heterocapsa_arctica.AAC.1